MHSLFTTINLMGNLNHSSFISHFSSFIFHLSSFIFHLSINYHHLFFNKSRPSTMNDLSNIASRSFIKHQTYHFMICHKNFVEPDNYQNVLSYRTILLLFYHIQLNVILCGYWKYDCTIWKFTSLQVYECVDLLE
jgi:hypothetical protein